MLPTHNIATKTVRSFRYYFNALYFSSIKPKTTTCKNMLQCGD